MYPLGDQSAISLLHPPNAIGGNLEITFLLKIYPGQNHRRRGQQDEQTGSKADLEFPIHRLQRLLGLGGGITRKTVVHVRGHGSV